jgi:peptidyl-prolyl cis-trans isomerase SurA
MNKKRFINSIILSFFLIFPLWAQPQVVDRIVAIVGKEPVLLSDLNAQIELYTFTNRIDPSTPGLKEQVLDAMINEKLILSKALDDTTITVSEEEVSNELDGQIAQRVQQFGSEKRVEEAFGMPISRLKREYRDGMKKQILAAKWWEAKKATITTSRREVEEFYNQFKDSLPHVPDELELYHIFMVPKISQSGKQALRALAVSVLDSIQHGGDFAEFAKRYSDDPGTKASGGDLGFVRRGEFFTEFEEAVFTLKPQQYSDIIETPIGFHIIQLLERRGEQVHPRHILFKFKRDASEADSTIALLKTLKDSTLKGANFSDLAKRYSEDKESASLGGLLGILPISQFDKSVSDAVKDLKAGDISDPVEVVGAKNKGYQIIYVKNRIADHEMSLATDWNRLEQLATTYKRNIEYQTWIKKLRTEIHWETRL